MKTQDEEQADHPIEWWASIASSMTDLRSVETMLKASSLEGRRLFAVQALATARFCIATIRDAIRTLLKGIDLRTLTNKEPRDLLRSGRLSPPDRKLKVLLGEDAFSYFFSDPTINELDARLNTYEDAYLRLQGNGAIFDVSSEDDEVLRSLAEAFVFSTAAIRKLGIPALRAHPKLQDMLQRLYSPRAVIKKGLNVRSTRLLTHP